MTLKLILGHTTLDVTQIYMHLAEAHVKVQHERFSPVDRLGIGFNTLSLLVFRYFVPYPPPTLAVTRMPDQCCSAAFASACRPGSCFERAQLQ
jgi:hypothetical protein